MKAVKITLSLLVLLADLACLLWMKREVKRAEECGGDEAGEEFIQKMLRWRYAILSLNVIYAIFGCVCIIMDI